MDGRGDEQLTGPLATAGSAVGFAPGQVILHEGDEGTHCFVVLSGRAVVTTTSSVGATLVLGRRGPGDLLGELSALDAGPRSARVVASTEVETRRLTAAELERALRDHPDVAVEVIRRLAAEVRSLSRRFTTRSEELRVRVLDLLRTHAEATGDPVFRSTREELAGWVGATREAVTRTLTDLAAERAVALRRGEVELLR